MEELTVLRLALLLCVLFMLYQAVQELRTDIRIAEAVQQCSEYYTVKLELYGWNKEPLTFYNVTRWPNDSTTTG